MIKLSTTEIVVRVGPRLLGRLLQLHEQLATAKVLQDKQAVQRQTDATDARLDRLIYELCDLTADEIRIVESGAQ